MAEVQTRCKKLRIEIFLRNLGISVSGWDKLCVTGLLAVIAGLSLVLVCGVNDFDCWLVGWWTCLVVENYTTRLSLLNDNIWIDFFTEERRI